MRGKSLPEKEAELIAAARSELAASPDVTARVAALLGTEQEARERRRKRLRQVGLAIPAMIGIAAALWLASILLRYLGS